MSSKLGVEGPEEIARRLMRRGLSDDAIELSTGLPIVRLLALRAHAAVEAAPSARTLPERRSLTADVDG